MLLVLASALAVPSYAQDTSTEIVSIGPVVKDGILQERNQAYVTINGIQYNIAPGFVIYDKNQAFVPLLSAPSKWPKIKYQLDLYGQILRVWLLEDKVHE